MLLITELVSFQTFSTCHYLSACIVTLKSSKQFPKQKKAISEVWNFQKTICCLQKHSGSANLFTYLMRAKIVNKKHTQQRG